LKSEILGQRIRVRREQLSLSQEQLGELIDKDQRAISEYETGKRRVLAVDLPDLSRALNVPIVYFFSEELSESDLDQTLLENFHHLPTQEYQHMIIRVLADISATILKHQSSPS
jgi:transcriptional regulator with XRE-family HTH domain